MKVLVVGQGGREHALVRSLKSAPSVTKVLALPGSDGMAGAATCHKLAPSDHPGVLQFCRDNQVDLVVVGPEVPLAEGLADVLRADQRAVFGPSQAAAQLEASKIFAKKFMDRARVPTARYFVVDSVAETMAKASHFAPPYVLKADGLAAGKGVYICKTDDELRSAAIGLFEQGVLGESGRRALLEEFQPGWELSFLVLTNGFAYQALPLTQDHKRLGDNDQGPNTGGMGVVGPLKIAPELRQQILQTIIEPSVRELAKESLLYRGVLYVGVMVTPMGPLVLEYNVRFGDPETQVILPLLEGDWGQVMWQVSQGKLPELSWKSAFCACVVLAAAGYPDDPIKGAPISGPVDQETPAAYCLHAGTRRNRDGHWETSGGRVLNVVGQGATLELALKEAYQLADQITWPGKQMRRDIGRQMVQRT
ncbi:MAG: phosphoribosylamine--glycine ligase [Bdellovibrionales bacterium]|nr:phosphoribosylamine--glycine ligase [Bdellovibrionales bacterium]